MPDEKLHLRLADGRSFWLLRIQVELPRFSHGNTLFGVKIASGVSPHVGKHFVSVGDHISFKNTPILKVTSITIQKAMDVSPSQAIAMGHPSIESYLAMAQKIFGLDDLICVFAFEYLVP